VGSFESVGVTTVHAVSNVSGEWSGFRGRVTDYLHHLPPDWNWHATDFYVCGNGGMVFEVASLLTDGYGVPPTAIHRECFSAAVERTPSEMLLSSTTAPALLNTQTDISVRNRLLRLPFAFRQSG